MIGNISNKKNQISAYQPSDDVKYFTKEVQEAFAKGDDILNRPYTELNGRSIVDDQNRGQKMFNALVDEEAETPQEAWKWRGTRSMARNKGIAMHANLTAGFLIPLFTAQNENDEEDRDFSEVMQDIIEWMTLPQNSNYQSSFFQVVFGMITNPVTYLGAEYCEVFQKIKERKEDGTYTTKEILDEVVSGFNAPVYSSSQILITNAYQRNLQRQSEIIKREYVDESEAKARFGNHPNWEFVTEGIKSVYDDETGLFYDVKDDNQEDSDLYAIETYYNRLDDTEVPFVNGIYFGDDNVEANPIKHRDHRNAPKYNVVPFGYHRIGEHFFAYKSMMNSLAWDNNLYDALTEIVMNRAMLETDMPIAVSGTDKVDSEIIFPSSVVAFEDKDTRITPLLPQSNLNAGIAALRETEKSINEGSVNETISGQLPSGSPTAYSISQAQANAKKLITSVGRSLAESVIKYGDLMKDIAINNITAPQVDELVSGKLKLKYRTFLLENKKSGDKVMNKKIKFDDTLIGKEMTDDEKRYESLKLLESTGYPHNKESIIRVNPEKFAKFHYISKIDVEEMFPKNQDYWQPVLLGLKQALAQDPYVNQEALTRKLMYAHFKSGADDLIVEKKAGLPTDTMMAGAQEQAGGSQLANMVQSKQLADVATGAMQQ